MKKRRAFSVVLLLLCPFAALVLVALCVSASDRNLIAAVKEGDVDRVKILLENGANPNFKDIKGWTALMYAVERRNDRFERAAQNARRMLYGGKKPPKRKTKNSDNKGYTNWQIDREINKLLLDAGADPNIRNRDGDTALIIAIRTITTPPRELIKMLSKSGADPDIQNKNGRTALIEIVGDLRGEVVLPSVVSALLECGANPDIQDKYGMTALMQAVFYYNTKAARVLLDWGADPAIRDNSGVTALSIARWKDARLVKMLIDAGADPNDIQKDSLTALLENYEKENIETARKLLESEGQSALIEAAKDDNMDVVKLLLENRAVNINAVRAGILGEETALNWAISNYNTKMARLLLNAGADPNEAGLETPALQDAVRGGYAEGVRLLLEAGANPNVRDSKGRTVLMTLPIYTYVVLDAECIRMLFRAGANPNLKDEEGLTALMWAILREEPELVQLLLEGGANP